MKRLCIGIVVASMFAASGCAPTTATPLRYAALKMPAAVPSSTATEKPVQVDVERTTRGGFYRGAQDVSAVLEQVQQKAGKPVLQKADVRLQTAPCYLVVCIGHDVGTAGGSPSTPK